MCRKRPAGVGAANKPSVVLLGELASLYLLLTAASWLPLKRQKRTLDLVDALPSSALAMAILQLESHRGCFRAGTGARSGARSGYGSLLQVKWFQ